MVALAEVAVGAAVAAAVGAAVAAAVAAAVGAAVGAAVELLSKYERPSIFVEPLLENVDVDVGKASAVEAVGTTISPSPGVLWAEIAGGGSLWNSEKVERRCLAAEAADAASRSLRCSAVATSRYALGNSFWWSASIFLSGGPSIGTLVRSSPME